MDQPGDDLFSGAGLPRDQHGDGGEFHLAEGEAAEGGLADLCLDLQHARVIADKVALDLVGGFPELQVAGTGAVELIFESTQFIA